MAGPGKNYVVGKGKVYFDPFVVGTTTKTAERYLGNTPELSTSSDEETLDHFDADSGLNVKDESVTIEKTVTGQFVTDNIDMDNAAMFFGGTVEDQVIASATGVTETHNAKLGRYVQLGINASNPTGARAITTLVITKAGTPVVATNNYEVDLALGRVYIEPDAVDIDADDPLLYTFNITGSTRRIMEGAGQEVRGSMRFISANPVGPQKDFYWPYVKLTPNGDFNLKSDEWLQMPFTFEVLKLNDTTERVYVEERTV